MATINPSQDYDIIHTLTYASSGGTDPIRLHRGSTSAFTGTVYYRAGTSGAWTSLSVSGTSTTFPITSTTMQIAHDWNKSGNDYMTPSFQDGTMTGIAISQKAVLSGVMGSSFMFSYASDCSNLTTLAVPDISNLTSVGNDFMYAYAYDCSSLTTLDAPDTSGLTSVGDYFMSYYAGNCTSLTALAAPDTSGLMSVGSNFMYAYAYYCSGLTTLDTPDISNLTSVGDYFMSYYAYYCSGLTTLDTPDISNLTSVGNDFMYAYAYDCSSLTTLDAPDTSGLTSVGDYFMSYYAGNCTSLTALAIPDTSGLTSTGNSFMSNYANGCTSLTQLILPKAGWFKTHNVDWSVPSTRLGNLKGSCIASDYVDDWEGLITSGETLHTNYIRDVDQVDNILEIDYDTTLNYGSGTYEDVAIILGANTASGVTLGLGGSPTFRSLIIQSKNSAAHTVVFGAGDSGYQVTADKYVFVGSSSSNRLTLVSGSGDGTAVNSVVGGSFYGQFVERSFGFNAGSNNGTPYYIGSNSIGAGGFIYQDPPKISTLVDHFDTLNTTTWSTAVDGTGNISVSDGKLNMSWFGGSSSYVNITTKDTYDLLNETAYIKVDSNALGLFLNVWPVYQGSDISIWAATEVTLDERFYRISATSAGVVTIDKYDGSWTNLTTETVSPEQLRSVRLSISGTRNMSDGAMVIDSVGVGPPANAGAFLQFF